MKKTATMLKRPRRKPTKRSDVYSSNRKTLKTKSSPKNSPVGSRPMREASNLEIDLFRMLMESTTDMIYFKDLDSRIILLNRSTALWYGMSDPLDAVGKSDYDFFTEDHARSAQNDEQKIIAAGEPLAGVEKRETRPDGRETWVSTTKFPLRNREGRVIGTFGISRDITEHKRGEEARIASAALREANDKLEKYNTVLQSEITERKQAEKALAYERDLFRTMMESKSLKKYH
jgi:PAS domain S-box-containing protein